MILHLRSYLKSSRQLGDTEGEGMACSALAEAYQSVGDLPSSIESLQENIKMAERTHQDRVKAETCCHLGVIYNKQGDFLSAKNYFEQCFELAKSMGDRILLDHSRVLVGIARGNAHLYRGNRPSTQSETPAPHTVIQESHVEHHTNHRSIPESKRDEIPLQNNTAHVKHEEQGEKSQDKEDTSESSESTEE